MTTKGSPKFIIASALFLMLGSSIPVYASSTDDAWILNRSGMYKIAHGNTEGAISDFEKACKLDPFNDTALSNLACARNNLGVKYAKEQNFSEAIRQFQNAKAQKPEDISIRLNLLSTLVTIKDSSEAEKEIKALVKLRPNDSDLIIKAATAYQKIENSGAAISTLQEYVERAPNDSKACSTLARLLYYNGNLTDSRFYMNKSLELEPNDEKNLAFLQKIDKEYSVEATTNSYTGIHFELACPESFSENWAEKLLEQLENAYEEIGSKLNYYPEQKAQVLLMQTEDFKSVHDLPDWAGGLYDGKIRLPVPNNITPTALKGAIYHEYTHHVVYLATSGKCPIWLNEGLAQIFEKGTDYLDQASEIQVPTVSLYEIDEGFKHKPDRTTAAKLYREAFNASCKFIDDNSWNLTADVLKSLALGKSFSSATEEVLGNSYSYEL